MLVHIIIGIFLEQNDSYFPIELVAKGLVFGYQ